MDDVGVTYRHKNRPISGVTFESNPHRNLTFNPLNKSPRVNKTYYKKH